MNGWKTIDDGKLLRILIWYDGRQYAATEQEAAVSPDFATSRQTDYSGILWGT